MTSPERPNAGNAPSLESRPFIDRSTGLDIDIKAAADSNTPVLITATPDDALAITKLIVSPKRKGQVEVVTCDLAKGDDIVAAMEEACLALDAPSEQRVLLLREVQTLTRADQAALMNHVAECQLNPDEPSPRIIASSSVNLFDYVERGWFDERLFYCLNATHIVWSSPW